MNEVDTIIKNALEEYRLKNRGIKPTEDVADMISWLIIREAERSDIHGVIDYAQSAKLWDDLIEKRDRNGRV